MAPLQTPPASAPNSQRLTLPLPISWQLRSPESSPAQSSFLPNLLFITFAKGLHVLGVHFPQAAAFPVSISDSLVSIQVPLK